MLDLKSSQFRKILIGGRTKPACFEVGGCDWVFRYAQCRKQYLWLASEFVACQLAPLLGVRVPDFCVARLADDVLVSSGSAIIPAGVGTATKWIEGAASPDLEHEPLEAFWEEERYLTLAAAMRIADTWMMNFDRRKPGNVVVQGNPTSPEVYFLDFDQAFLAKYGDSRGHRLHWTEDRFGSEMLTDRELLSGFDGRGKVKNESAQRREHFEPALLRLNAIGRAEIEKIVQRMPQEWGIDGYRQQVWVGRALERKQITLDVANRHFAERERHPGL